MINYGKISSTTTTTVQNHHSVALFRGQGLLILLAVCVVTTGPLSTWGNLQIHSPDLQGTLYSQQKNDHRPITTTTTTTSGTTTATTTQQKKNKKDNNFRFLFGIVSMDSPTEGGLRQAHRETYLSYYKLHLGTNHSRHDTICSLSELMNHQDWINDRSKCQFVYTFVIGGGNQTTPSRCLWGDGICGGTSTSTMIRDQPGSSFPHAMEYSQYQDITLLNIRENLNEGKTDTWFSYVSALISLERPDLGVDFVGKLDSDTVTGVDLLLQHYKRDAILFANDSNPYLFGGGDLVDAEFCSRVWKICDTPNFTAPIFFGGGMMIFSSALARHAYLEGTLQGRIEFVTKQWLPEDLVTANFAYADPNITVRLVTLRQEERPLIFAHGLKTPTSFVDRYWQINGLNQSEKANLGSGT
jgi:hypothetical protein